MSHEKYFFDSAIILTTHCHQNYAQSPYRGKKSIETEVWLEGASKKGLEK